VNLRDLVDAIGDTRVTPRFVRFLIAQEVIPHPRGGRAHADYDETSVDAVHRYLRLRDMGLSIAAIRLLNAGKTPDAVALDLGPGLTLTIRPAELTGPPDARALVARIAEAIADLSPLSTRFPVTSRPKEQNR
jgi:DNA-binding transcriptional MerR regulator